MPKRVRMTRHQPWRAEHPDAVIVARPSKFGNPYTIAMMKQRIEDLRPTAADRKMLNPRGMAVAAFESDLRYGPGSPWWWYGPHMQMIEIKGALQKGELRGKDLACWCPHPAPGERDICHAAVLIELANQESSNG